MTRRALLAVAVEYDDAITEPYTIASYLGLVLDAAHESLDQCGPLAFGEVAVHAAWTPAPELHGDPDTGSSHTYPDRDTSTDDTSA